VWCAGRGLGDVSARALLWERVVTPGGVEKLVRLVDFLDCWGFLFMVGVLAWVAVKL